MVWDYSDKVKDLFMNAINNREDSHIGEIENPDGKGFHGSLVCGDAISLTFSVEKNEDPTKDKITDIKYKTFGCTSAIASSEAMAIIIKEKQLSPINAAKLSKVDIVEFLDGLPNEKVHCSIMGVEALQDAVKYWAEKRNVDLKQHGLGHLYKNNEETEDPTDNEIVCECNGLTRGFLKEQIENFSITTLDDLMEKTGAGTVCGSCIDREGGLKDILMEMNKGVQNQHTPITEKTLEEFETSKINLSNTDPEKILDQKEGEEKMETKNTENNTQEKSHDQIATEIETVLNNEIAPMLGYDNGGIEIVEIKNKVLYFRLEGACSTCSVSDYTVDAIRETLKNKVDQGIEVQRVW